MYKISMFSFILVYIVVITESANILCYFPTPSISHQVVFRPVVKELVRKGHEVYVITPDPIFQKGEAPKNLIEVDVHNVSYALWNKNIKNAKFSTGKQNVVVDQLLTLYNTVIGIFENQMQSDIIQTFLKDKSIKVDLVILESYMEPGLILAHYYKAPIILMSSMLPNYNNMEIIGSPTHPILYPMGFYRQKVFKLSWMERITELFTYNYIMRLNIFKDSEMIALLNKYFGEDLPSFFELRNNIDMLFVNVHPVWDMNRPAPPNVVYLGGLHLTSEKELPKDLQTYLDSSKSGVIYVSFGTNINPSALPQEKLQTIINVLSRLPYDVLLKWDKAHYSGIGKNIRAMNWLPQSDLLRHPKVLLFVTQGGLQSIDEAIEAGVPMIGIPMLGDQWYNMEQCEHHKVGIKLLMDDITEEKFENAINSIINDKSYRDNTIKLRSVLSDRPESSLERAVWWTEYVIRHGGAKHLRSPSANIYLTEYLQLEFVLYLCIGLISIITLIVVILKYVIKLIIKSLSTAEVQIKKDN